MSYYQQYHGRFYVNSDLKNFAFDIGAGLTNYTLTEGWYYITQYSGEGINQFCQHMQAVIVAEGTYPGTTVTYSFSTGKVTINANCGGNFTITWTDTLLQSLLGFTGTQTGQTSYTATNYPRYTWRPSLPISDTPLGILNWWDTLSTTVINRSSDGSTGTCTGNQLYEGFYNYEILPEADVLKPSTGSINRDFESFWLDVVAVGQPIRIYPDRASSSNVKTGFIGRPEEEVGKTTDSARRYIGNTNIYFGVSFDMVKQA